MSIKLITAKVICILIFYAEAGTARNSLTITQRIDSQIEKRIVEYVNHHYFPQANVTSLGLAVVKLGVDDNFEDGQIFYTKGFGMADIKKGINITGETQFRIGSLTKMFTVAALLKVLHEKFPDLGESVMDTPIQKLVPDFDFVLSDRFRTEHATIRDLLAHRMCLFRDDIQMLTDAFDIVEEVIYRQRYSEEICGMRDSYHYNNQMVVIAGEILAHLTKKKFTEAVDDFLSELGLFENSFLKSSDDFSKMPERAQPYYVMDGIAHSMNPELVKRGISAAAAGALFISLNDMARFLEFHLNMGQLDGKEIIPEDVMMWMRKPSNHLRHPLVTERDGLRVTTYGYGFALMQGTYNGFEYLQHGGLFQPYRSYLSLFPEQRIGIFTTGNQMPVHFEPIVLHSFIFETIMGQAENSVAVNNAQNFWVATESQKEESERKRKMKLEKFLDESIDFPGKKTLRSEDLVGKYGSGAIGDVDVFEKWNHETNQTGLFLVYGKWYYAWLVPVPDSGNTFNLDFVTDVIQDAYTHGEKESMTYVRFVDEILEIWIFHMEQDLLLARFTKGLTLDKLRDIPWLPESCGPD